MNSLLKKILAIKSQNEFIDFYMKNYDQFSSELIEEILLKSEKIHVNSFLFKDQRTPEYLFEKFYNKECKNAVLRSKYLPKKIIKHIFENNTMDFIEFSKHSDYYISNDDFMSLVKKSYINDDCSKMNEFIFKYIGNNFNLYKNVFDLLLRKANTSSRYHHLMSFVRHGLTRGKYDNRMIESIITEIWPQLNQPKNNDYIKFSLFESYRLDKKLIMKILQIPNLKNSEKEFSFLYQNLKKDGKLDKDIDNLFRKSKNKNIKIAYVKHSIDAECISKYIKTADEEGLKMIASKTCLNQNHMVDLINKTTDMYSIKSAIYHNPNSCSKEFWNLLYNVIKKYNKFAYFLSPIIINNGSQYELPFPTSFLYALEKLIMENMNMNENYEQMVKKMIRNHSNYKNAASAILEQICKN